MSQCGWWCGGCDPPPSSGARPVLLSAPSCGRGREQPESPPPQHGGCPGQPIRDAALRYSIISKRFSGALGTSSCGVWRRHPDKSEARSSRRRKTESASCSVGPGPAAPWTVHGVLQARILQWGAFPFSRRSSQPRDRTQVSCIAGRFFAS